MTDAELTELESAAKAATPGPWYISGCYGGDYEIASKKHGNVIEVNQYNEYIHSGVQNESDAAYIAAANPATILELIAELRQAKAERDWLAHKIAIDGVSCPVESNVCAGICEDHVSCWLKAAKEATCQK